MEAHGKKKYRNRKLKVRYSGRFNRRSAIARELERVLDREFHSVFVRLPVVSEGISDARCRKQHPWRVQGRRVAEVLFEDPEDPVIDEVPTVWARFIDRCRDAARRRRQTISTTDEFSTAA